MRRARLCGLPALAVLLASCGHHFPAGEGLIPATYGPPFGSALTANRPHHPHNPAAGERHAEPDAEKDRRYRSFDRCRAALGLELARRQPGAEAVAVSAREAVGHASEAGVVHEYRCVGGTLSYRAWHQSEEGRAGAGEEEPHR